MILKNIIYLLLILTIVWSCQSKKSEESEKDTTQVEATKPMEEAESSANEWQTLFNGKDLIGWRIIGGDANFSVEDGKIVGVTEEDIPNCFLVTDRAYDDFVLELEFKIAPEINSGVQIRSSKYERDTTTAYLSGQLEEGEREWKAGRFHGYQIEIDPSERAWTGGLYEEGGRGWLQHLNNNQSAQEAYKQGEWNKMKIKAEGNHIQSWVNGVTAADATDDAADNGFIGLQLHSAWKDEQVGKKVMFRDIKVKEL